MSELAVVARRNFVEMPSSSAGSVLIVDDEAAIRESLEALLGLEGYEVEVAATGREGLARLEERVFDLVLLDLALPDRNGMDVLGSIRTHDPQLSVIMITAYGTVENAVRAIQAGATNFIQKPWDNEKLLADVRAAVARRRAEEENIQLKRALKQRYNFENIVGKSEAMLKIFDLVAQVAPSRSTVLLQGESGTGKELIAKAIHLNSPRRDRPFVPVNTGSMPTDLLESTLFGHVKGAFTSAIASKKACSRSPIAERFSSTKSAPWAWKPKARFFACCRTASLCTWAVCTSYRWMCALLRRPMWTCGKWSARASSARIFSIV